MFEITLIAMGKLKEKFYTAAAAEYEKRLSGYCHFKILELPEVRLPENPSPAEISAGLEKEAALILTKIPKGSWFCVLTPEGKLLSSEELAHKMDQVKQSGKSSACFLIGSSFGIAPELKQKADLRLSMSPMTFPHHRTALPGRSHPGRKQIPQIIKIPPKHTSRLKVRKEGRSRSEESVCPACRSENRNVWLFQPLPPPIPLPGRT